MATYRVLKGLDYLGKRREPGDEVSDIPSTSVDWLLRDGAIAPVTPEPEAPRRRRRREAE